MKKYHIHNSGGELIRRFYGITNYPPFFVLVCFFLFVCVCNICRRFPLITSPSITAVPAPRVMEAVPSLSGEPCRRPSATGVPIKEIAATQRV